MTHTHDQTAVYAWLIGQPDNLGDSVLRRAYAAALAEVGALHVWAGPVDAGYISGLGLPKGTVIYPSFADWYRHLAGSALRRQTVFAFNAGEFLSSPGYFAGILALAPWLLLSRARSGKSLWVGGQVRKVRHGITWPFRWFVRHADLVLWRDTESARLLGRGRAVPDWAFGLWPGGGWHEGTRSVLPAEERHRLAISLRGDRPYPSREWIAAVRAAADRLGLRPTLVVQVERDSTRARRVAADLGAELVDWVDDAHVLQERRVRNTYRCARVILSDRLHSLIIAATEGALPLGAAERATEKIERHFDLVGAPWVSNHGRPATEVLAELDRERVSALEKEWVMTLERARAEVHLAAREIGRVVNPRSRRAEVLPRATDGRRGPGEAAALRAP